MIDILFDQYQRYNNVASIINSMRVEGEVFNILEVGANEHQNLEKFLPDDRITYLDIQLPENLRNNPKYILGDATAMDFLDNEYNIVVALDVFEHIADVDRANFISEIHRVSSDFFVITAPFDSMKVVEAERRVNAVYKSIFNKDFIWLEEHMVNGLPNLNKLTDYLDSRNISHEILSHGDLNIWETMMTIHFVAAQNSRLGIYRNEIDRYYNQYIFGNDFVQDSYRKICIGSKQRKINLVQTAEVNESVKTQQLEQLKLLERNLYVLAGLNIAEELNAPKDFLQFFRDEGEGYTESNSIKIELENNIQHIDTFFESKLIKTLRLDPSNHKGVFEIKNLRIATETKNLSEEEYAIKGNYNWKSENVFVFYNDDPSIIFEFVSETLISRINFDIYPLSKEDAIRFIIDHFDNQINEIEEQTEKQKKYLEKDLLDAKEQNIQFMMTLEALKNDEAELNFQIEDLKRVNNLSLKDKDKMHLEVIKLQQENATLQQENATLQQENTAMSKELNTIYSSKGWVYLTKLKKVLGR